MRLFPLTVSAGDFGPLKIPNFYGTTSASAPVARWYLLQISQYEGFFRSFGGRIQPAGRPFFGFPLLLDLNWGGTGSYPAVSVW